LVVDYEVQATWCALGRFGDAKTPLPAWAGAAVRSGGGGAAAGAFPLEREQLLEIELARKSLHEAAAGVSAQAIPVSTLDF